MYLAVKDVISAENYELILTFENNERREFDVKPLFDKGAFSQFKNKTLFETVKVSFDTIEWGNGTDLDPELLYEKSTPFI